MRSKQRISVQRRNPILRGKVYLLNKVRETVIQQLEAVESERLNFSSAAHYCTHHLLPKSHALDPPFNSSHCCGNQHCTFLTTPGNLVSHSEMSILIEVRILPARGTPRPTLNDKGNQSWDGSYNVPQSLPSRTAPITNNNDWLLVGTAAFF